MSKSRCGAGARRRALVAVAAVALCAVGCAGPQPAQPTAEGRVWKESFAENFSVDLGADEADCLAAEVQDLTRLVGPLVGLRPDDTARSVFPAVDACVSPDHQDVVAEAILAGPESAGGPSAAPGACVRRAGGWAAVATYERLVALCGSTLGGGA